MDDLMEMLDMMESSSGSNFDLDFMKNIASNVGSGLLINNILAVLLGVTLMVFLYIMPCYVLMFQGRKTGLKSDWFAYVPVVSSIYRMDMIREDRWKILFVGGVSSFIKSMLVGVLILLLMNAPTAVFVLFDLLVFAYFIVCIMFKYMYNRKFLTVFGYNAELSLLGIAGDLSVLLTIVSVLGGFAGAYFTFTVIAVSGWVRIYFTIVNFDIAFNDRIQTGYVDTVRATTASAIPAPATTEGQIVCTAGMYQGAVFTLENNFEIIIGRDSYYASIVINEGAESISRKHCGIRYDLSSNSYVVTDYSTNGTFTESGERLQRNVPRNFPSGAVICLGDKKNRFKLV